MSVDVDFHKRLAELIDGDQWQVADLLVEQYPESEYPSDASGKNGLVAALREDELALAREYGIVATVGHLREMRSTAIAWPVPARTGAPFVVHRRVRGVDREAQMTKYLRMARREGRPLSERMLLRYRADERNDTPRPFEERMRRAIAAAVRRELLGGITTKREDWWMVEPIVDDARAVAVAELRALASAIARGAT